MTCTPLGQTPCLTQKYQRRLSTNTLAYFTSFQQKKKRKKFHNISTHDQCYKTFMVIFYIVISCSVSPCKDFPLRATQVKHHYSKMERLTRDNHSNLLRILKNYGRKKVYNIGPRILNPAGGRGWPTCPSLDTATLAFSWSFGAKKEFWCQIRHTSLSS